MNTENFTTVMYTLENGTKIIQPITKESFFGEKGRKRTEADFHKLFRETAYDKRAISYTIDSDTDDTIINEKEIHFSKNAKKVAKREYKEFMKSNPQGFKKSLKDLQKHLMDSLSKRKRLSMNITNIILQ